MQFLYLKEASCKTIELVNEPFKYIVKARRMTQGDVLHVRNLQDENLYTYCLSNIQKRSALLSLQKVTKSEKKGSSFRLGWSVIDPKIIERTLPCLNEMGVGGIDFVYTEFSQKNFKIDLKRLKRILISSCEQCGRSDFMDLNVYEDLQSYFSDYSLAHVLDFGGKNFSYNKEIKQVLIGCEGGFSEKEREMFDTKKVLGLNSNLILKSQSAACAIATKVLL